jgi:hypothetical protein
MNVHIEKVSNGFIVYVSRGEESSESKVFLTAKEVLAYVASLIGEWCELWNL